MGTTGEPRLPQEMTKVELIGEIAAMCLRIACWWLIYAFLIVVLWNWVAVDALRVRPIHVGHAFALMGLVHLLSRSAYHKPTTPKVVLIGEKPHV